MNILLIGGGGREHALAWKMAQSPGLGRLYAAPGNAGIAVHADCVALDPDDHRAVIDFCDRAAIDLVVVGPEAPLVGGLADALDAAGIPVFGPSAAAARLEGSKGFTKDLCARHNIPTAAYERFADAAAAKAFVRAHALPIVIKADGLAAGKGVVIAETLAEADTAIDDMLGGRFGAAGESLVIEEFLAGEEASFFALVAGEEVLPLVGAQDHKRAYDGDKGPNTGGMGAYSPAPVLDAAMASRVMDEIMRPTARALATAGTPYRGVLYAGLMITPQGPKLIEYNVRFGDPECQVLMMRLASDIVPALAATAGGRLDGVSLAWRDDVALTVVMAAKGYPGQYEKGSVIRGLAALEAEPDLVVFHAGTTRDPDGTLRAAGGRVLNVTARAPTVAAARARVYEAIDRIDWPEGFCRRDIGWRALGRGTG
ncbi:MAG: phosphoribosylamine--glycine ligase [Alphaproteobacteria bacterium]|nr:MAG: phosphoribosylamine--glycine ligase [Alphaproteobacteria bacterium]